MAAQNQQQTFFEVIKPGSTFEFIGMQRYWIGLSIILVALTVVMLPLNAFVFKSRGHMLNWGVDFRGGTELVVEFATRARSARCSATRATTTPTS
jgi:preprotein translocase subunit SecF